MKQRMRTRSMALAALTTLTLLTSACEGRLGSQGPTASPEIAITATVASVPTAVPTVEASPAPAVATGPVTQLMDVKLATIQIRSKGNFVEPGALRGQTFAGSGSGFLIDSSGLAITNNHVVTGAALIEVFVAGEDRPRNARVVAVSECSDLALIDVEGDGFRYLEWFAGAVPAGMTIYTAGFPLGDPEFTITSGVVSKERTSGETSWASVERVIEHDAAIRPGNSGGPLVNADGQVVAVNFAAIEGGPYFAIGRDEALAIIDQLKAGQNVTSLGLNGQALKNDEISGIWAWSVASGSPLDNTGVRPGDFITRLEGLEMATDGTMADYCQIQRSRNANDVLGIQVFRPGTGELLEGQVNGRKLEVVAQATPSPRPTAAAEVAGQVVAFNPGQIDVVQARAEADAARSQYRQLDFETFDRAGITRNTWREDGDSILRDNFYRLVVRTPNTLRESYWRPRGSERALGGDYVIEVRTAFDTRGAVGGVGLSFDGQRSGDGVSFIIRSDNTWQVVTFVNGAVAAEYSTDPIPTTAIIDGNNDLRVWRTPGGISLWINNTPVGVLRSSPFSGGFVGVAAAGGADVGAPISLIVDNFRVLER